MKTSISHNHIVLATGLYDLGGDTEFIGPGSVPAQRLFIHGGYSVIRTTSDTVAMHIGVDASVRSLEIIGNGRGLDVNTTGRSTLERVKIGGSNAQGISISGDVLMRDVSIEGSARAIVMLFAARLTLNGGVVRNPYIGILSNSNTATVDISNLLVFGASVAAIDLRLRQAAP